MSMYEKITEPAKAAHILHSDYSILRKFESKHRRDFGRPPVMGTNGTAEVFMRKRTLHFKNAGRMQESMWINCGFQEEFSYLRKGRKYIKLSQVWDEYWEPYRYTWPFLVHAHKWEPVHDLQYFHIPSHFVGILNQLPAEHFAAYLLTLRQAGPERFNPQLYQSLRKKYPNNGFYTLLEQLFFDPAEVVSTRLLRDLAEYRDKPSLSQHEIVQATVTLQTISEFISDVNL